MESHLKFTHFGKKLFYHIFTSVQELRLLRPNRIPKRNFIVYYITYCLENSTHF